MNITTRRDRGQAEIGENLGCLLAMVVIGAVIVAVKIWGH